jgi:RNA polymerase primary sigma factor
MISLDTPLRGEHENASVSDFIEDTRYEYPEAAVINMNMKEDINTVLDTLTPKEADIIRYRYGLDGSKAMSLKEIGDMFNLTKERIRQIEKKAIRRLQHSSRMNRLEAYVA